MAPPAADTLRILLATDSHLGYREKDSVRGGDSFRSFKEALSIGKREKVDFVLLAGDLFHDNRPSRTTLYQTMSILRSQCMGPAPVQFQVVSDQSLNFPNFGAVNYEDPNFNVELPIFSIHGNHDDPTRDGAGTQPLAALDLLSAANLINYFGQSDRTDLIEIFPVLICKGKTKLAIYGLGSMMDERLHRMFAQKKVVFRRPAEHQSSWFSIFVVHQNRDNRGRGSKNCLPESFIPDFIDFVLWGHEHECLIEPTESAHGDFFISQPGSSVATSLIEGESESKRVGILQVHKQSFHLTSHPLTSVRKFKMDELSLSDQPQLDPNDAQVADRIQEILEKKVKALLAAAQEEAGIDPNDVLNGEEDESKSKQVLIRLRVEHSGFPIVQNQRFGQKFVGQIANPNDILLFHRRKERASSGQVDVKAKELLQAPTKPSHQSETVETFLRQQLSTADDSLRFFPEKQLGEALETFVRKNAASALEDYTKSALKESQTKLHANGEQTDMTVQQVHEAVKKQKEESNQQEQLANQEEDLLARLQAPATNAASDSEEEYQPSEEEKPAPKKKPALKMKRAPRQTKASTVKKESKKRSQASISTMLEAKSRKKVKKEESEEELESDDGFTQTSRRTSGADMEESALQPSQRSKKRLPTSRVESQGSSQPQKKASSVRSGWNVPRR